MTVHVTDLLVQHGRRRLVDVPDLRLERGRPVTIVGESGSGKSLLAHAVMGTLAPELTLSGRMLWDGTAYDLADRSNRRRVWGRELAMLPQEPGLALDPTMRVRSQVAEGDPEHATHRNRAATRATGLLAGLGLGHAAAAYPHTLSGGMAQRVAFAAATIGGARFLIVDEPSKGLDEATRDQLAGLLLRHSDEGGYLLTITHDLALARRLGGDALVTRDAEVLEAGPASEVLVSPRHSYTRRLLAAEPERWEHDWMRAPAATGGAPLVEAEGVGKAYGDQVLFSDLSLRLHAGERWALTGPSGSGKTTLGGVLLRLVRSDSGRVRHSSSLGRTGVQKLYQDPGQSFPARVPIGLALRDVLRAHRIAPHHLEEVVTSLGLATTMLERHPGAVSGGELQRLAIARAVLVEPALLFADEPTSRLDLLTQEETMRVLMSEIVRRDCALLLVTHDVALADRVAQQSVELGVQRATAAAASRGRPT